MGSSPSKGDKQDDSHSTKQSNNDHHHHMMPLFRKQSGSAKKKLQHKQYLAREDPELTYDISDCEISDIPAGTFSLIKVLQKEALLANNNWLTALKGGGSFKDLLALRIFDLHDNELVSLPNEIDEMKHLQVLNLENNKLKNLPTSIGSLISLQTLNLKGNKLKELPDSICKLRCLRTLNVHKNQMTRLPPGLCEVRTLETLVLDAESMTYPPADICSQGTEAIMRFLCSERGLQYEPPSKFLLDVLDVPTAEPSSMKRHSLQADVIALHGALQQYESMKEEKRRERALLEKQLEDDQRLQAQLAAKAAADKKHLIEFVAKDQDRFDGELAAIQNQKEQERGLLVNALREAERSSGDLVNQLLEMNEKARRTEELVEQMERERMEAEEWFIVRQEEAESLRKREVIAAMEQVLAESQAFNLMIENYLNTRGEAAKNYQEKSDEMNHLLESLLDDKLFDQKELIEKLMTEEKLQKEAFETLMLQKDAKTQRITSQIELIEQELAQLTLLEVEQRDMRLDTQMNILAERRVDLTALLVQLMQERDSRVEQLRERLDEMEQQKEDSQIDYWLIQYQRLMDRKPQSLINQEKQLEYSVIEILERTNAADYIPTFARHRITIETMCQMDEEDLKQMTIHELGVRKSIMTQIERYKQDEEERAAAKLKGFEPHEKPSIPNIPSAPPIPEPSAPPAEDEEFDEKLLPEKKGASGGVSGSAASTPSAPELPHPGEVTARDINTECVICMEETSSMLFLNCGHVCTCDKCSPSVDACPLCRANIVQRIRLMVAKASFSRQTSTASQK